MNHVALVMKKLYEVGSILARDASYECHLLLCDLLSYLQNLPSVIVVSLGGIAGIAVSICVLLSWTHNQKTLPLDP